MSAPYRVDRSLIATLVQKTIEYTASVHGSALIPPGAHGRMEAAEEALCSAIRALENELVATREALECQIKHCGNGQIHTTAVKVLGSVNTPYTQPKGQP